MDIQDMRIFVRVAALQNQSAVATELKLAPSTISKRLDAMEKELKVRLFDRSTRSSRITEAGKTFLSHATDAINAFDLARSAVCESIDSPKGKITVSAPVTLGHSYIAPAVCAFMRKYPEVDIQIDLTDTIVNLQERGYDLAIRTGDLPDSSLIAKRLVSDRQIVVAAPNYIRTHSKVRTPSDLAAQECLVLGGAEQWPFRKDGDVTTVRVGGRLQSDNGEFLRHAAVDGLGIFRTSRLQVEEELQRGELVTLLDQYGVSSTTAISAIYPSSKHLLPKLRVFIDFLADWFRAQPMGTGGSETAPLDLVVAKHAAEFGDGKPAANR